MDGDQMDILCGQNLGHVVDGRWILDDVSVSVTAGERVALIGPSGSGKSTLLGLLAGIIRPTQGRVLFRGEPVDGDRRRQIALILQGYGLVSLLTAEENIEVVLHATGHSPAEARRTAAEALETVGLGPFATHLTDQLSGGQQQRMAVALALARRPAVILADEPTAEQDPVHRDLVLDRLLAQADRGAALVLATHDPEVADRCDRIVRLDDGRLAA
ncbi:ABC transporter ATP-binding protein [Actinomadura alba]|nr:ATP-binding cassette domain-containing protein [Actinomadura alba]